MADLSLEEGITVPLVEYGRDPKTYIIRIKHPTMDWVRLSPEIPKHPRLIIDPEMWTHEFVELAIRGLLHNKFQDDSGDLGKLEGGYLIFGYNLPDRGFHSVAHILSALFTVSGYNDKSLSPEEYAELLPWGAWKRRNKLYCGNKK